MKVPRRGKPVQPRTLAMCRQFTRRKAKGHDEREIISDLVVEFGIKRSAIWKALRSGKAVPPYQPKAESPERPPAPAPRLDVDLPLSAARIREAGLRPAPGEPCPRCNVRADIGCRHQAASGPPPPAIENQPERLDRRFRRTAL